MAGPSLSRKENATLSERHLHYISFDSIAIYLRSLVPQNMTTRKEVPGNALGEWLKQQALREFDLAGRCLAFALSRRHKGVHEGRKAIRRLRALLALSGGEPGPQAVAVSARLQTISRNLSTVRDAHVVVVTIEKLLEKEQQVEKRQSLRAAHRRFVETRRRELRSLGNGSQGFAASRALLEDLRRLTRELSWEQIAFRSLVKEKAKSERRADRYREATISHPVDVEKLHVWRRKLRRLRHQLELLQALPAEFVPDGVDITGLSRARSGISPQEIEAITDLIGRALDFELLRHAL